jgi:hypothetical protein
MEIQGRRMDLHLNFSEARRSGINIPKVEFVNSARGGQFHSLHIGFLH